MRKSRHPRKNKNNAKLKNILYFDNIRKGVTQLGDPFSLLGTNQTERFIWEENAPMWIIWTLNV